VDSIHGPLPGPILLRYSVFVFSFSLFFVSVPCARLIWPPRQLLSARKSTVSHCIVSFFYRSVDGRACWWFQIVYRENCMHKHATCRQRWVMTSCSQLPQLMLWRHWRRRRGRLRTWQLHWLVTQSHCQSTPASSTTILLLLLIIINNVIVIITIRVIVMSVTDWVWRHHSLHICRTALYYNSDIYSCSVIVIIITSSSWQWRQWWCRRQWHSGHVTTWRRLTLRYVPRCTVGRPFSSHLDLFGPSVHGECYSLL